MKITILFSLASHAILLLLLLFTFSLPKQASSITNNTDQLSLLEFKSQITEDPQGVLTSWNSSLHFCNWNGVICGLKHKRVTSLNLQGQRLAGIISPNIGNLSFLQIFNLADNSFHGEIPSQLGNLFRLQNLNLSFNFLAGEIPVNLSRCSNLIDLVLDHNYLKSHIPQELGSLSKLESLYLKNNNLTGRFPSSIGNLTYLQQLYLSYNDLDGEVPDLSNLRSLKQIGISVNSLSGEFPSSLYNLSSLLLIGLSFNRFSGNLRNNIGLSFPNLQRLYLAENFFIGSIPVSLSNASQLLQLDIPDNNFTGTIPMSFGTMQNIWWLNFRNNSLGSGTSNDLSFIDPLTNCSQLQFLDFSNNQFGGSLPFSITNLSTQLTRLLFGQNRIVGAIPEEITNLVNLNTLSLDQNFITGPIPASIGKLLSMQRMHWESNRLTGEIPSSFGNLTQLLYLNLGSNSLEGTIPPSLGNCKFLETLDLSQNKLNGTIPKELMSISSLSIVLNVSYNLLTGPFPEEVGNLTSLGALDVSNNKLSGKMPNNLENCIALELLYMQENNFQGPIIPSLSQLINIQFLDLSRNNLSGQIPQYMANLSSLLYLNLSFNNLEGEVPVRGVFRNVSVIQVFGNINLCGGVPELNLNPCLMKKLEIKHKKHIPHKLILVIIVVFSCLALLVSLLALYFTKKAKHNLRSVSSIEHSLPKVSYEELLNATSRFSSDNLIGSGSFGTVYKGILSISDETINVAIKVLNLRQRGASKSFIAECQALRNIRHRNLVKVLTACSSIDFEGNDFKALVYQFMPKGSLEKWLHPEEGEMERRCSVSILQRINIAIDIASALYYLHHQCERAVVHCDLKPSNVLLDDDMTAHVSDFGLARLLSKPSQDANLNQFSSLGIKGTIGYAAPEYGMGGEVSTLGDVYSYGILLLEMFTGRRPTDELFKDNLNLHNYVKQALPYKVMEIVDKTALYKDVVEEDSNRVEHCSELGSEETEFLVSVLQIAVVCSADSPQHRMNMREVVTELITIRDMFLGATRHEEQINSLSKRTGEFI